MSFDNQQRQKADAATKILPLLVILAALLIAMILMLNNLEK